MSLIGTRAHAAEILDAFKLAFIPKGWSKIGRGGYRTVYLHDESQVVYKCERICDCGDESCLRYVNRQEVKTAQALRRRNYNHIRIPLVSGFSFGEDLVVAMEYVRSFSKDSVPDDAYIELYRLRFADMHNKNFFVDQNNKIVPVDMASPRNEDSDTRCLYNMRDDSFLQDVHRRRGW